MLTEHPPDGDARLQVVQAPGDCHSLREERTVGRSCDCLTDLRQLGGQMIV